MKDLNLLTSKTKEAVKTLLLTDNRLSDLDGIQDFVNIEKLYVSGNSLSNLGVYISKMLKL